MITKYYLGHLLATLHLEFSNLLHQSKPINIQLPSLFWGCSQRMVLREFIKLYAMKNICKSRGLRISTIFMCVFKRRKI